jgi:hypothetical protein
MFKKPEAGDMLEIADPSGTRKFCALVLELQGTNIILLHNTGKVGWIGQREFVKWSGDGRIRLQKSP